MNIKRLNDVKAYFLKHPELLDMSVYAEFGDSGKLLSDKENPHCGSVGCIAGLTVALNYKNGLTQKRYEKIEEDYSNLHGMYHIGGGIWEKAKDILKLTEEEANHLFLPDEWPNDLYEELSDARNDSQKYAEVVARRIDYLIENGR